MSGLEHDLLGFVFHYRYFGLFLLLSLGMIGIPVPDEFIMVFSGFQTSLDNMSLGATILVACAGSMAGMNLSYFIGRQLDIHVIRKIKIFNIDKRFCKAEKWFAKFGDILIVIGYFFPGFRHFTAYFAGMSKFSYKKYFGLVSLGALIWTVTYILLGRMLGRHWREIIKVLYGHLTLGAVILGVIVFLIYFFSNWRKKSCKNDDTGNGMTQNDLIKNEEVK